MTFTRYADDLTFSTNDKEFISKEESFIEMITKEIHENGLRVNQKKTRVQFNGSRQVVTGM